MDEQKVHILLVEDNKDFAKLVEVYLQRYDKERFDVVWKENYTETMSVLEARQNFDIILMDYFLPGKNGLDITRELVGKKYNIPVVFLTVNKDFDLALDAMKLGVDDYLVKEEISSPALPKTVLSVVEKHRLRDQLAQLQMSEHRLNTVRQMLAGVMREFEVPLAEMHAVTEQIKERLTADAAKNYVKIMDENVSRIIEKLEKLKQLKAYKTIKYIKDIKMIDLS